MEARIIQQLPHPEWKDVFNAIVSKLKAEPSGNPTLRVGIEVEAENFDGFRTTTPSYFGQIWRQETDGSLRNNGAEFISFPIPVSYVRSALALLFGCQRGELEFSKRTSIHIHVDVTKTQYQHLINLIYLYICFEDALFRYAGDFRRKSIFCVPLKETNFLLRADMLTNPKVILVGQHWTKYTAMNLLPVSTQGTVEFRHLQGTNDIEYISTWVEILARMKLYSEKFTYEELSEKIFELVTSSQYYQLALEVFGDLVEKLFPKGNYSIKELDNSVKFLKSQLISSSFMKEPMDLKRYFGHENDNTVVYKKMLVELEQRRVPQPM